MSTPFYYRRDTITFIAGSGYPDGWPLPLAAALVLHKCPRRLCRMPIRKAPVLTIPAIAPIPARQDAA